MFVPNYTFGPFLGYDIFWYSPIVDPGLVNHMHKVLLAHQGNLTQRLSAVYSRFLDDRTIEITINWLKVGGRVALYEFIL